MRFSWDPEKSERTRAQRGFDFSFASRVFDTSPPELKNLPEDFWDDAVGVTPGPKTAISIRVDDDVLQWFRSTGQLSRSRINAVLRSYMDKMKRETKGKTKRRR